MKKFHIPNPLTSITGFFRRFHMTLFILIVLTALGGAVLLLAGIIKTPHLPPTINRPFELAR